MPLPEYHLDERRIRALVALYSSTRTEITRYRDYEWRITAYALALFGASIALSLNDKFRSLWSERAKGVLAVLVVLIGVIACVFILYFNRKFGQHRDRRQRLDDILGFTKPGVFADDPKALLPVETG